MTIFHGPGFLMPSKCEQGEREGSNQSCHFFPNFPELLTLGSQQFSDFFTLVKWPGQEGREHVCYYQHYLKSSYNSFLALQSKKHIESKWHYYKGILDSALMYFLINKLFPHVNTLLMITCVQRISQWCDYHSKDNCIREYLPSYIPIEITYLLQKKGWCQNNTQLY